MKVWFVYLDAAGKYHAWREDSPGLDLPGEALRSAVRMASAELQRARKPWVPDGEKAVMAWALEAPSRYQAIKLCQAEANEAIAEVSPGTKLVVGVK